MAIAALKTSSYLGNSPATSGTRIPGTLAAAKPLNPAGNDPLVKQSQRFVAHAFFGTILKQMHDSPWRSEMFSGGKAGRSFESLLDDRLADRMASTHTSDKLVRSIVRKLDKKAKAVESARDRSPSALSRVSGGDRSPSGPSNAETGGFGETALPVADPVDAVLSKAAEHLQFLSETPRIDLKG